MRSMRILCVPICLIIATCDGSGDDPCAGVDCGLHGLCVDDGGRAACDCDPGYVADGLNCTADPCAASPCVYGSCRTSGRNAICDCYPGYAGARCDTCAPGYRLEGLACVEGSPCDDDPCVYGRCRSVGGLPVCDCFTGYAGELCDECAPGYHAVDLRCVSDSPCDPDPCVHGSCSDAGGLPVCDCHTGYAGEYCDQCAPGYHSEGLTCVPDVAGPCDPNPCTGEHRHICQPDGDSYVCLCDPGYHDQDGACVPDAEDPCDPNPCQQVHRSVCQADGESYLCLCDPGYHDQDGSCVEWVCDTVVTYAPEPGETIIALYIRGEFNGWRLDDPFYENPDGSWTAILSLDAGDYAYKLYEQGGDRWFNDPGNPFFKWEADIRNSRLHVRDCDLPLLRLVSQPVAGGSDISFQVEYIDGAQGAGVDPASVEATRNDEPLAGVFDPGTGVFTIADSVLADGKYAYRFRASDNAGRPAERLYVPVWIEDTPFAWEDAVLYFAMIDRFVNGDPSNDAPVGGQVDFKADWQGGDIAGLLAKIEDGYFDLLGVNAIWISSVTQNTAGAGAGTDGRMYSGYHSYWPIATGWRDDDQLPGVVPVDPHFGDLEEFKELVRAAHARGIRVLIDFVANHVHTDSPLWQQHQLDDPPWFHLPTYVCGWDQPITCWFAAYLPDFEYKTLDVMNAVVEHAVWLIRETDVDGFRLDAVKHMIHDFSYTLRGRIEQSVTTTGLRFYMVGETFTGEGEGEAGLIREYVRPEELDGQFDFPLFWSVVATFLREERDFYGIEGILQTFDGFYGDWAVMSNFLGNHDVARAVSHANGDIADLWGNGSKEQGWNNPPADPAAAEPYQRLRLAWTFLMTIPGIPLIYCGDEFGMAGAGDPDNRRMMKFGADLSAYQQATLEHVARLTAARHAHRAMRYGDRTQLFNDGLFWAYSMVEGSDIVVVAFNRNSDNQTRSVPVASAGLPDDTVLRDAIHDTFATVSNGQLSVNLDGRDSAVFVLE